MTGFNNIAFILALCIISSALGASINRRDSDVSPKAASRKGIKRILQLTDLHYDKDYSTRGSINLMCHSNEENPSPSAPELGKFGDYSCDSPPSLVEHAILAAKAVVDNPEYIIWTGDSVPHRYAQFLYDEDYVIATLESTSDMLNEIFPGVRVLPAFGNHDYSPVQDFPDGKSDIYQRTFDIWKPWIGEQAGATFLRGGFYKYEAEDGTIFLILNTNLYSPDNTVIFINTTDPAGQFEFMEKVLSDAEQRDRVIHIAAHIGPGVMERVDQPQLRPEYNRRFLDITIKYSATIKWMLFGHLHTDTFRLVKDRNGDAVQVMLMCPSITPMYFAEDGGANNPAFRVFEYNPNNWAIADIKTYYVDLEKLNNDSSREWELEYSMRDDYKMDDISAKGFEGLLTNFKTSDGSSFSKYISYNTAMREPKVPVGLNKHVHLCALEHSDLDEYQACVNKKADDTVILKGDVISK